MKVVTLKDTPNVPMEGAEPIDGYTEPVSRSRQTIIQPGESANYNCSVVNFSQGCTTGWHTHSCDQLLIVTSGSGMVARPIRRWGISRLPSLAVKPPGDSLALPQDAVGRADAILNAGRAYRAARYCRALGHGRGRRGDHARATRPLPAGRYLRWRQHAPGDGPDVPARRQHVFPAREPPRRVLARPAPRRPDRHDRAAWYPIGSRVYLEMDPGPSLR